MASDLSGRVALVLGGSKGIGFGVAEALAGRGARVAIASRTRANVERAAALIGARPFVHDSSFPEAAADLVAQVEETVGAVSILVLNTGGPPVRSDPLQVPVEEWEAAHRTLLLTPLELLRAVLPGMRRDRWGRVVSIASTAVREPMTDIVLSGAYRSALASTLKVYSREVAAEGVTINSLLPGDIATDRLLDSYPTREAAAAEARELIPAGRLGQPSELAALAAFLCSDAAGFMTGVLIPVDGGKSVGL